ncbi:DNA primase [Yoonia sp. F2084L]|uniref:DNA primase n=1 Tax=Yoonia sp. F2084L TaxID=2926419 RepID=UPI001FF50F5F|nr:DNA primase [Yoonia sp. F2084L]MCK0097652.1 DNA primase [Yoonia sp. F2084L]
MSLPPGFLDELRNRLSLGQVVGRKVMWDTRKSNQGKGDLWAPCPFHQEKTASFHVDDRKGFYYCFGCHAKGDAISFVRETENVDFMEAVKILAGEAGMPIPEQDPQAQQKANRRDQLIAVMEQAVAFYRLQLKTAKGAEARDYLANRGLKDDALDRWEIGLAPPGWSNLWQHLTEKGVDKALILEAGLARSSDQGKEPYDTFRNRIMFPIRDGRGRCIAFGGRAIDPGDNAKYLNSPETPLFDKSRSLFNVKNAREAAGKGHPLIVAEGYMDVIALSEAGFKGAVAPLGTAVTDTQLDMMWRIAPEPIIMLDGDTAGRRAAERVIDLALGKLQGGNSLFFLELPAGKDPDDFLRENGRTALQAQIDDFATPLVKKLWLTELNRKTHETPEQKADLDKRLRAQIGKIPDQDIKRYYGDAIKNYRWETFKPANWAPAYKGRGKPQNVNATGAAKQSLLAGHMDEAQLFLLKDRIIAAIALTNPAVAIQFRDGLERFEVVDATARTVIDSIVSLADTTALEALENDVKAAIGAGAVDRLLQDNFIRLQPCVRKNLDADIVLHELTYNMALVSANRAVISETIEAEEDLEDYPSHVIDSRLFAVTRARDEALRGGREDTSQFAVADNGTNVDIDERNAFDALLAQIEVAAGKDRPKS